MCIVYNDIYNECMVYISSVKYCVGVYGKNGELFPYCHDLGIVYRDTIYVSCKVVCLLICTGKSTVMTIKYFHTFAQLNALLVMRP